MDTDQTALASAPMELALVIVQVNALVEALTPSLSVTVTVTVVDVPTVVGLPVMTPLLLMLSPAGALASANVHGVSGQVDATVSDTAAPTSVDWVAGVVIVGAASTVQVKFAVVAVPPSASVDGDGDAAEDLGRTR